MNKVDEHVLETFHELDPNGKDPHEAGAKLDAGKNRLSLVLGGFGKALQEVGKVGTFGANKYTDNGWKSVENGKERYTDALLRHYFKEVDGELKDEDSKLLHAAHLAWNALARLELMMDDAVWMYGADHMMKTWQDDIGDRLQAAVDEEYPEHLIRRSHEAQRAIEENIQMSRKRGHYTDKETGFKSVEWPTEEEEERMGPVGQNGNDGDHYEFVKPHQDDFEE